MDTKKSVIYRFRHALAFMTVIVFLFCYGMVAYAAQADTSSFGGAGVYTVQGNDFRSELSIETDSYPFLSFDTMCSNYNSAGYDPNNLLTPSNKVFLANETGFNYSMKQFYNNSERGTLVLSSCGNGSSSIEMPTSAYYMNSFSWNSSSSQQWYYNWRFSSSGNIGIVSSDQQTNGVVYIVSDAPISYICTRSRAYDGKITTVFWNTVETSQSNGFYEVTTDWNPSEISLTNLPIYIASSDGDSGFTNYSSSVTDFSFGNNNFDFNYLIEEGFIVNPNPTPDLPVSPSGNYLNNALRTVYERAGSDIDVWSYWTFNQYVKLHPEEFNIHYDWSISFKTSQDTQVQTFDYTGALEAPITAFMLTGSNKNSYFRYPINFSGFKSGNTTLNSRLQSYFQAITGTTATFYDDWDLFGTGEHSMTVDPQYSNSTNQIDVFIIYGTYVLVDDQGNSSGIFQDSYNFMTGNYDVVTNDIVNNYNPPDAEDLPSDIPLDLSSETPNTYSNSPVFNDGDVYLTVNNGNNPFTLDDISYANLKNMFNDIEDFINSTSENSFWTVLERTFSYIPAKIWEYIIISVAVICGFAVARYVVRR